MTEVVWIREKGQQAREDVNKKRAVPDEKPGIGQKKASANWKNHQGTDEPQETDNEHREKWERVTSFRAVVNNAESEKTSTEKENRLNWTW